MFSLWWGRTCRSLNWPWSEGAGAPRHIVEIVKGSQAQPNSCAISDWLLGTCPSPTHCPVIYQAVVSSWQPVERGVRTYMGVPWLCWAGGVHPKQVRGCGGSKARKLLEGGVVSPVPLIPSSGQWVTEHPSPVLVLSKPWDSGAAPEKAHRIPPHCPT